MSEINLISITFTNLLGISLIVVLLCCNMWLFKTRIKQTNLLLILAGTILLSCIADPIIFFADGKSGTFYRFIVYAGNFWLYSANIISNYCWIILLNDYLNVELTIYHLRFLRSVSIFSFLLLISNFFYPIVFYVDENNRYSRQPAYIMLICICLIFVADGLVSYYEIRKKGGMLKFFPVWVYVGPLTLGIVLQSIFYGISVIWPFGAISLCGMVFSFQNNIIFRDTLTGLYNRHFLELIKNNIEQYKKDNYTALMLDLNNFKHINDTYGHLEGDFAIVSASNIIKSATGKLGIALRYAGDEFIVVINSIDKDTISDYITSLNKEFERFNKTHDKPYILSASLGECIVDLNKDTVDEIIEKMDHLMYEDKAAYYEKHKELIRRK